MTTNIGSLAVSLSLDAASFNGSIDRANRNLGAMGSELRAVRALGTDYGNSLDGLRAKKDILTRSVGASTLKLEEERRKYDELVASGTASEAQLERQARRVNEAQTQFNRLSTELGEVTDDLNLQSSAWHQLSERLGPIGARLTSVGDKMTKIGKDMSMKVTAPILAAGVASAKLAIDFEAQMSRVGAIAGATGGEMDALKKSAMELGADTSKSAGEVAIAMEEMAAMGFTAVEIMGAMPGVISASEASGESLALASQTVAAALNIWGLEASEASRVADVLAMAANASAAGIGDMQMAFKYAGAPAAALGIEMEDVAAAIGIMTDAGLDGSGAGTALRASLLALNNPAKAQEKMMKRLGISMRDEHDEALSLSEMVGNLIEATEHMTEADKVATLGKLVGTEAVSGFLSLMKAGPTEINNMSDALRNSAGESARTAAVMKDNLKGAFEELGGALETAGITIGNVLIPHIRKAVTVVQGLVEKFTDLSPKAQKTIMVIGGVAAAIGPLLVIGGTLTSGLGGLLTSVSLLSGGIAGAGGLGAAMLGLAAPVGIAVLAIGGIAAAGYALYKVLNKTSIPEIDIFGEKVSENSKKAVGAFTKLNDEATVQLNGLKWSGTTVTKEMADELVGTYSQMGDTILTEMQTDHAAQLATARGYFADTKTLTEEEQKGLLDKIVEGQTTREESVRTAQIQYSSILRNAADERRGITSLEQETLDKLQREMMETGIKHLSESEEESLIILERLKLESGKITAEQAIDTASRARESRDAVVDEAEKKYEETIAFAMLLKEDGSKESEALYKKIVEDAENTRDEAVAAADGQYNSVITIAKEKGDEYVTETELRLGKVQTLWQKTGFNIGVDVSVMSINVVRDLKTMSIDGAVWFSNLREDGITAAAGLVTGIRTAIKSIPGIVRGILIDAAVEAAKSVVEFVKVGEDIVAGLKKGMAKKAAEVAVESYNLGKSMVTSISKSIGRQSPAKEFIAVAEDAGKGLVVGMKNSTNDVTKASKDTGQAMVDAITGVSKVISAATKKNAEEIVKIDEENEKNRIAIKNDYAKKRAELARKSAQSSQAALKTSKNKKGQIVTTGAQRVHNIHANASAQLIKLNEDEQKKLTAANDKAWKSMVKKEAELSKERLESVKTYVADKKSLDELSLVAESEVWRKSLVLFKEGSKERVEIQKSYQASLKAINDEVVKVNDEYAGKMTVINDRLRKEEEDLTNMYVKSVDERAKSLASFAGIFDAFEIKIENSGAQLLANLGAQVDGFKLWQTEIEKLSSKAIDEGLIAELREMGVKALPQLLALNTLTDDQMSQYSALYQEKAKLARTQAEAELVGMKTDTATRITELRATANIELEALRSEWVLKIQSITKATDDELKSLKQIGVNAGQGLLDGLASMEGSLVEKARSIANAVSAAMASALQVNSPSLVTTRIGEFVGKGLEVGMENSIASIRRAARMMANAALPDVGQAGASSFSSQYGVGNNGSGSIDNSKSFAPTVTIYTQDSGAKEMERTLRRMAFSF